MQDEEGHLMQGAIFGDDIEVFADALKRNGHYEISNAPIKSVPPEYREQIGDYQMTFNGRMRIKPLDLLECSDEPQYRPLSAVPRSFSIGDALNDVVAIVLHISDVRIVAQPSGDNKVRDIFLVDHSVECPMKLSAWNQFAVDDSESLPLWHEGFFVVGFKGLYPVTTKGLGLKTTVSTTFISAPTGASADGLRLWMIDNSQKLQQWQQKCVALDSADYQRL